MKTLATYTAHRHDPSHAFRPIAENELCRHATGIVQMVTYAVTWQPTSTVADINVNRWNRVRQSYSECPIHDFTVGSTGLEIRVVSLPKLLSDHQIGGPVVFWKLLTIKKSILTTFLKCAHILFLTNQCFFQ